MSTAQGNVVPRRGRNKAYRWAAGLAAIATVLGSGLFGQGMPQASAAGELVTLTNLTVQGSAANPASFATMTSNTSNLTVQGGYQINDTSGAGAVATITLKPALATYHDTLDNNTYFDGLYYFSQAPSASQIVTTSAMGAGTTTIDPATGAITVTIPFTGGALNDVGNFTVVFPFDHATFDAKVPNGTKLADVEIAITKGGQTSSKQTTVNSSTSDDAEYYSFYKSPATNTLADTENSVVLFPHGMSFGSWRLAPGSYFTLVLDYPQNAVITNLGSSTTSNMPGTNDVTNHRITWTLGPANADGIIENGWYRGLGASPSPDFQTSIVLKFPSNSFSAGDSLQLSSHVEYTRFGESTMQSRDATPIKFNIISAADTPHMLPDSFSAVSGQAYIDINSTALNSAQYQYSFSNGEWQDTVSPIPNTCLTWYNDSSYKKARPVRIDITNLGALTAAKLVFTIKDANDASYSRQEIKYQAAAPSGIGGAGYFYDFPALTAGQYFDKIEIYPLDNPSATAAQLTAGTVMPVVQLPIGASPRINFFFASWAGGIFPDGTPMQNNDRSLQHATLTWEGEVSPVDFSDEDNNPVTITISSSELMVNYTNAPRPQVQVSINSGQGGSRSAGDTIGATLSFGVINSGTDPGSVVPWVDPVIYVMPPSVCTIDISQPLQVYAASDLSTSLGDVAIEDMGSGIYKLTLPNMTVTASTVLNYRIPLAYTIKPGTAPGTYYLTSGYGTGTTTSYPSVAGRVFGSSRVPNDLPYPADLAASANWMPDPTDIDGNPNTTYLYLRNSSASFSVIVTHNLAPSAALLDLGSDPTNPADDTWQNLTDNPDASATVPLAGTGTIRLELQNKGNSYVGDLRLLDILPALGDKTVRDGGEARGSEWQADLQALTVRVYNADGVDVTDAEGFGAWTIRYSSNPDPNYTYSAGAASLSSTGSGTFSNDATLETARSFDFYFTNGQRLPGGYTAEIEITVKAPETATVDDINASAYNSFAVTGNFYSAATGGSALMAAGPFEPPKQEFILADGPIAAFDNAAGVVYKDLNGNDTYEAGTDQPYGGVTVELVKPDGNGGYTPVYAEDGVTPRTTTTDENGQFTFTELYSGDYVFHIVMPDALTSAGTYSFDTSGGEPQTAATADDLPTPAATYSMVNGDGYTPAIMIDPGAQVTGVVNAGIKASTTLTVQFKDEATNTVLADDTVGPIEATYQADGPANMSQNVSITPSVTRGDSDYTIPAGYHIVSDDSQTATFEWNDSGTVLSQTITFMVAKDTYALTFDLNGAPGTAPDDQVMAWDDTATAVTDPTWDDHTFLGWETADGTAWVFGSDGTPMPQEKVTLYAQWAAVPALSWAVGGDQQTVLDSQLQAGDSVTFTHTLTVDPVATVTVTGCTATITSPASPGEATAVATPGAVAADGTYPVTVTFSAPDADGRNIDSYQIDVVCNTSVDDPVEQTTNIVTDNVRVVYSSIALGLTVEPGWGDDASGAVGDTVTWQYAITNDGTADLTDITLSQTTTPSGLSDLTCVDENDATVDIAGGTTSLAGGKVITCTATSKVAQSDIDNAGTVNAAVVAGLDAASTNQEATDSLSVPLDQSAAVTVEKKAFVTDSNGNDQADLGEQITFKITLTNTGNVTLRDVTVTDSMKGLTLDCSGQTNGKITLTTDAPDNVVVCTTSAYTITAADVAAGQVVNVATADGQYGPEAGDDNGAKGAPGGGDISSEPSEVTVTVTAPQAPTGGQVAPASWLWLGGIAPLLAGAYLLLLRRRREAGGAV